MSTPKHTAIWIVLLAIAVPRLWADGLSVAEIIELHVAALGGKDRIAAVHSLQGFGHMRTAQGEPIRFRVLAARPNRLRLDYYYPKGTLSQGFDGKSAPWELDGRESAAKRRTMESAQAELFKAGADFDDALLTAEARGDTIEFGGTIEVAGRPMIRLLVTHQLTQSFFLMLDAREFLIRSRIDPASRTAPRRSEIVTEYDAYRPISGVLAPCRVTVWEDGRLSEQAELERVEGNPELRAGVFSAP